MAEKWNISGSYFETCNCESLCPCIMLSPPTDGECKVLVAWHIEEGRYGNVDLGGLNVVMAAHAPGHMMEVKWKGALYFDDKASPEQTEALTTIFAGQAGGHFEALVAFVGEVLGVASVPIVFQANGKHRSMKVANIADAETTAIQGWGGADVKVTGQPLTVVPDYPTVVGRGQSKYKDHGYDWEFSNKGGMQSDFSYEG